MCWMATDLSIDTGEEVLYKARMMGSQAFFDMNIGYKDVFSSVSLF